jgi:hypothetical protein
MNRRSAISRHRRTVVASALVLFLVPIIPAMAQKPADSVKPVVTIDGAREPERIPDWILWREFFSVAVMLAEKAPDSGRDIWMNRLGLSQAQMNHLIVHGRAFQDEEKQINRDAVKLVGTSAKELSGPVKSQLHQMQADKESRILGYRDALKSRIGKEAVERMQSFARLHIAPTVKVGTLMPDKK